MADENYISLYEATEYCDYSQEYLSLRARQGKLKSVKFGRNWVTKKEWLDEYLKKVEEYNNFKVKQVSPPKNLPVEPLTSINFFQPQFVVAIVLAVAFLFTGLFLIKENSEIAVDRIYNSFQLAEIEKGSGGIITDYFSWLGKQFVGAGKKIVQEYVSVNDFLERKITQQFIVAGKKIVQGYVSVNDFLERKIGQAISQLHTKEKTEVAQEPETTEEQTPQPVEEGLVVIPSTDKDEEVIKKIKDSFSDEVKVELKDETSGIITPVFREGDGENYLYILVPINK
jgi:hypothetical protein